MRRDIGIGKILNIARDTSIEIARRDIDISERYKYRNC